MPLTSLKSIFHFRSNIFQTLNSFSNVILVINNLNLASSVNVPRYKIKFSTEIVSKLS